MAKGIIVGELPNEENKKCIDCKKLLINGELTKCESCLAKEKSKKTIKPIEKKNFSLSDYKGVKKLDTGAKDKPLEYIPLSSAFQTVTGLIGLPKGYVSILRGYTNTGKSTALIEAAVGCQREGIIPVIIDTENGFNWNHARDMGFIFEYPLDEETGELGEPIGDFIYINNDHLINLYGKKRDKNRDVAVIEDVADFVNGLLEDQLNELLPNELCFLWDSVGTLDCEKSITSKSSNNMWNANAIEACFKSLITYRIPASRKENKKYTNTFVVVNKIWLDSMQGAGIVKHKGGEAFYYSARLVIHFGGVNSHGTKKLVATANGREWVYATQTKVTVDKNHVEGASYKGELVSTAHGFILPTELDVYKKQHKNYILSKLGVSDNTDITFSEKEINDKD